MASSPAPAAGPRTSGNPAGNTLACWNCSSSVPLPPKLVVTTSFGTHHVLLTEGATLSQGVIAPGSREEGESVPAGQVVRNPADPTIWGIRNLSRVVWRVTFPDGQSLEVPLQKSVPLNPGTRIDMGGVSAEIIL